MLRALIAVAALCIIGRTVVLAAGSLKRMRQTWKLNRSRRRMIKAREEEAQRVREARAAHPLYGDGRKPPRGARFPWLLVVYATVAPGGVRALGYFLVFWVLALLLKPWADRLEAKHLRRCAEIDAQQWAELEAWNAANPERARELSRMANPLLPSLERLAGITPPPALVASLPRERLAVR